MLRTLLLQNFRCFELAFVELDGCSVGLVGPNASGKTSALEALFFLSTGRSFRTADRSQLLRRSAERLLVKTEIVDELGTADLQIVWTRDGSVTTVGGRAADGVAEVASRLRAHLIEPGVHRLIEGGPTERRRLLDMGVFHVEHGYASAWRTFRRVLKQRNASLRGANPVRDTRLWDDEFVKAATAVDAFRRVYSEHWATAFKATAASFDLVAAGLNYRCGWDRDVGLQGSLAEVLERDIALGYSTVGPQRADVSVTLNGRLARRVVSRGQQKLLASGMVLSQARLLSQAGHTPLILLDDPGAELDVDNLGKFLRFLAQMPFQIVAAATFPAALEGLGDLRWFHVKQDGIAPML